jgi:hypothetical protein
MPYISGLPRRISPENPPSLAIQGSATTLNDGPGKRSMATRSL